MAKQIIQILNHRNFILSLSILIGFALGDLSQILAELSIWVLALVMVFASSGFAFSDWKPWKKTMGMIAHAFLVNYLIFGFLLIVGGYLFFNDELMISGFILLAVSPPGASVVPFSAAMKGDIKYAISGVFGLYTLSILITPLALIWLLGSSAINPQTIIIIIIKIIIIPLLISRFLRNKKILPKVEKVRGSVINWGFFLIIIPIIGLSKELILNNPNLVLLNILLFAIIMFGGGFIFNLISNIFHVSKKRTIASNLMFTTKSSAFAAVAAFGFLPAEAALPAAINTIFIIIYFIVYDGIMSRGKQTP